MKGLVFITGLLLLGAVFSGCGVGSGKVTERPNPPLKGEYKEGEIIVKFREGVSLREIERANNLLNTEIIKVLSPGRTYLLKIPRDSTVEEMIERYQTIPSVEYAEPNYIVRIE